jgi:hypothetical protein
VYDYSNRVQSFIRHNEKCQLLIVKISHALQDPILYIYKNTENLPSARICGILFQGSQCFVDEPSLEWSIDIDPGSKPEDNRIEDKKANVRISLYIYNTFIN